MKKQIVLTFTEPMLGTVPANPEVYQNYIASQRPEGVDESEAEDLPAETDEMEDKMTVFRRDAQTGWPCIMNYMIKGHLKESCGDLRRITKGGEFKSHKLPAYKKRINGTVFIVERRLPLEFPEGWLAERGIDREKIDRNNPLPVGKDILPWNERPLRTSNQKGERTALACSEEAPIGTKIRYTLELLDPKIEGYICDEWIPHGARKGLGQWRSAGYGTFTAEIEDIDG